MLNTTTIIVTSTGTKIDVAYWPKTETNPEDGSVRVYNDDSAELPAGYNRSDAKSNIVYVILPTDKVIELDHWEEGCSENIKYTGTYDYFFNVGETNMQLDHWEEGCDSVLHTETVYTKQVSTTFGTYGFNDYNGNLIKEEGCKTGMFEYRKLPRYYGIERIPYYIYNEKYAKVGRRSNTAYITIICGNENVPDSCSLFLIPNAISPNGDGLNDEFQIVLPPEYEENHTSKLEVYNRWGTLVYRSSGTKYGRDCPNWDGTSKTANMVTLGSELPQGTYFYVFTIDFNIDGEVRTKKLHGYVELRR